MFALKNLLTRPVNARNPRELARYLGLLWMLVVGGTLLGFCIQALAGARAWADVPGALLPVLLGAGLGCGIPALFLALRGRGGSAPR
ncbi:hypothetical protein [Mycetocola spongiae]|uniref:hypothetical protein n=1 Tax=Mycetocola spongiae TaxID=2859226 RepID=UPI001CF2419E|nr:hypothetical protein [Mycetocola spongiae]UCR88495.1 hypothetical protein KXZ72_11055 [Mycetocola spongiae]